MVGTSSWVPIMFCRLSKKATSALEGHRHPTVLDHCVRFAPQGRRFTPNVDQTGESYCTKPKVSDRGETGEEIITESDENFGARWRSWFDPPGFQIVESFAKCWRGLQSVGKKFVRCQHTAIAVAVSTCAAS